MDSALKGYIHQSLIAIMTEFSGRSDNETEKGRAAIKARVELLLTQICHDRGRKDIDVLIRVELGERRGRLLVEPDNLFTCILMTAAEYPPPASALKDAVGYVSELTGISYVQIKGSWKAVPKVMERLSFHGHKN